MLKRSERIKYSGLFAQAFQKGHKLYSKNLCLAYTATREHLDDSLPLVGFSISKNYSKKANKRNKLKRQLREIYRLYRQDSKKQAVLKKIGLLIIQVKSKTLIEDYQKLKSELEMLLAKVFDLV